MQSKKNQALVHAVDQMLDYFELSSKEPPSAISVSHRTYDALLEFERENKSIEIMQLTHYRKVPIKVVSANTKT